MLSFMGLSRWWCRGQSSDVALEDARLSQAGQALANRTGAPLAYALHGHEVFKVRREQLLEAPEMVDQPFDDGVRQAGHLGQEPVAAGADRRVEGIAADDESHGFGAGGKVEQLD